MRYLWKILLINKKGAKDLVPISMVRVNGLGLFKPFLKINVT